MIMIIIIITYTTTVFNSRVTFEIELFTCL